MIRWHRILRRREYFAFLALLCLSLFLLASHRRYGFRESKLQQSLEPTEPADSEVAALQVRHVEFWKTLYSIILNNNPQCETKPEYAVPRDSRILFEADHDHIRPDVMWMNDADLSRMKTTHSNFVKDIDSTTAKLVYNRGTQGITTTASDQSLTTLTISLFMLRKTGSKLSVEVFLDKPTSYTIEYCSTILRPLDVKCRFLSEILAASETPTEPHSFQFKILAIIFSSFEDVLLLDADAWPVTQPDPLFYSLPFTETGLVLWPDFWYPSESPYFFEIAKIHKIPQLNDRPATESGMIMYSKAKHSQSIMLAAYYNHYGPDYYYHLQSQGGQGEGDKETYLWAAVALDKPFYFVKQGVRSLGRYDSNNDYVGTAMAQSHPAEDFYLNAHTPDLKQSSVLPRPLFIHANVPKIDPYKTFDRDEKDIHYPIQDQNGTWVRAWMPRSETIEVFGMDVEESLWETIRSVICDTLRGIGLPSDAHGGKGVAVIKRRDQRVCRMINEYMSRVYSKQL